MADESPIGSPLSDLSELSQLSSDAFYGHSYERNPPAPVPSARKRQKVSDTKESASPPRFTAGDNDLTISSDSEGEVPNSPNGAYRFDDDDTHEQVTICIWEGCNAGDMGNMDNLVKHIHAEHIESRGKKYPCEWGDCTRRGANHASAYALKAHMRSHTREKPFYCDLPECDRAFTRSDALAKHYRTVHETEALRPSDPIPKSMQQNRLPRTKPKEIKPMFLPNDFIQPGAPRHTRWISSYPAELGFTEEDEVRGPKELYRLLRRQIKWAEEDSQQLKKECEDLEEIRKCEWLEKELLLDQTILGEESYYERYRFVRATLIPTLTNQEFRPAPERVYQSAYSPPPKANRSSPAPLYHPSQPVQQEANESAAAILASMNQQA